MSDLIEQLNVARIYALTHDRIEDGIAIDKAIKALTPVLPEDVQSLANDIRNNSHIDCVCYENKTADKLERLALNVELYKTMHEINKHCLDREDDYACQAIWDADEIEKLQERIAELEAKYNLLLRHTTPRPLADSLKVEWVDIPEEKAIKDHIDEMLCKYLLSPKGDNHDTT